MQLKLYSVSLFLLSLGLGGTLLAQNVGIGIPSPDARLDVAGAYASEPSAGAPNGLQAVAVPNNTSTFRITEGAGTGTITVTYTGAAAEGQRLILINEDANDAASFAGVTIPAAGGTGSFVYANSTWRGTGLYPAAAGGSGWSLTGNGLTNVGTNYLGTSDGVDFAIRTTAQERIRVTAGGVVGVSEPAPSALARMTVRGVTAGMESAVYADNNGGGGGIGFGAIGRTNASSEYSAGVLGLNRTLVVGSGVTGISDNESFYSLGYSTGVTGVSDNVGVYGHGTADQLSYGVFGRSEYVTEGTGVVGAGNSVVEVTMDIGGGGAFAGSVNGAVGFTYDNAGGTGLIGIGNALGGVLLLPSGSGVSGYGQTSGIYGYGNAATSQGIFGEGGLYGIASYGRTASNGIGSFNCGNGLVAFTAPANGAGAMGGGTLIGVFGRATSNSAGSTGVWGEISGTGDQSIGVYGAASGSGVAGRFYFGVWGANTKSAGNRIGVYGAGTTYGVWGSNSGSTALAGTGNLVCSGTKSFRIDHPLEPEKKYLHHYCTEAPEPQNFYSGNVVTDTDGRAIVALPAYFETLNKNYRYTLTPVGTFAQAMVEQEVKDNSFVIRTDKPNVRVSWLVIADRNDPYVQFYPPLTEPDKEDWAQGRYLFPQGYGRPEEEGIEYVPSGNQQEQAEFTLPGVGERISVQVKTGAKGTKVTKQDWSPEGERK